MKTQAIIFDLDGTLWDATNTIADAWNKVLNEIEYHKKELSALDVKQVAGKPYEQCMEGMLGAESLKVPGLKEKLEAEERRSLLNYGGPLYPGVKEGLMELSNNHELFLASNCQAWYMDSFFANTGLKHLFKDAICHGHTGLPKHENIKTLVDKYSLKNPVYVGDTHWDHASAEKANVDFIFVRYGFGKITEPARTFDKFEQVVRFFNYS